MLDDAAAEFPAAEIDALRTLHEAAAKSKQISEARERQSAPATLRMPPRPDPAVAERAARADASARQAKVDALVKASSVPVRYADASLVRLPGLLDRLPVEARGPYADAARRVAVVLDRPCLVALLGSRGPGKTWLACAAVLDACRAGRRGVYLETADFLDAVKETYDGPGRESQVLQRFVEPWLLVLDEAHVRGNTPWEDQKLTRLINKRYAEMRATVLVSNQDEREFEARIGLSIADRFHDDGGDSIVCNWGSLRGRVQQ